MENNFYKNLFCTCILSFYSILMNAQQWVWHEIEEENDGGSPVMLGQTHCCHCWQRLEKRHSLG